MFVAGEAQAPANMRTTVATEKWRSGIKYILYLDDGRRNIDCGQIPKFNSMVENWERYTGSINLILEKATEFVRGGSKIFPEMEKTLANYLANDLASNLLTVAKWIGDDAVKSVKNGTITHTRDD